MWGTPRKSKPSPHKTFSVPTENYNFRCLPHENPVLVRIDEQKTQGVEDGETQYGGVSNVKLCFIHKFHNSIVLFKHKFSRSSPLRSPPCRSTSSSATPPWLKYAVCVIAEIKRIVVSVYQNNGRRQMSAKMCQCLHLLESLLSQPSANRQPIISRQPSAYKRCNTLNPCHLQ